MTPDRAPRAGAAFTGRSWWLVAAIVGAALLLRLHQLDHESLWMDETRQASYYGNSPRQLVADAASQNQPPLDYWIGSAVAAIDPGDFAVRLPAALFGTATVLVIMLLAVRLGGRATAWAAGAALATSPYHVYYSQEARPYAISIFFFTATALAVVSTLETQRLKSCLWVFVCALGYLYSRALAPLVSVLALLGVLGVALTLDRLSTRRCVAAVAGALALAVLAYVPGLLVVLRLDRGAAQNPTSFALDDVVTGIGRLDPGALWRAWVVQLEPLHWAVLVLAAIAPAIAWAWRAAPGARWMPWLTAWLVGAMALHLVVFQSKTALPFRPSYAVYALPLALLLGAWAAARVGDAAAAAGRVAGVIVLVPAVAVACAMNLSSTWAMKRSEHRTDWRGMTDHLEAEFGPEAAILISGINTERRWAPGALSLKRYYQGTSRLMPLTALAKHDKIAIDLPVEPVLALFYFRPYYLTPDSSYPLGERTTGPDDEVRALLDAPDLRARAFTGFVVVTLPAPAGRLGEDLATLLERTARASPGFGSKPEVGYLREVLARQLGGSHARD